MSKFFLTLILLSLFACNKTIDVKEYMSKIIKIETKEIPLGNDQFYTQKKATLIGDIDSIDLVKGELVELSSGLKITLKGHGHKAYTTGPESPEELALVTWLELYFEEKKEEKSLTYNPNLEEKHFFTWNGFAFELVGYDYGKSAKLKVSKYRDLNIEKFIQN